jgi:hypothetical protein
MINYALTISRPFPIISGKGRELNKTCFLIW